MRHSVFGKKLSRDTDERKRLYIVLVRNLFTRDAIITTMAKAKAVQPIVEKLITKAKKGARIGKSEIFALLDDKVVAAKLMEEAKTRFSTRSSGYTRIIKLGKRASDASEMVQFSFVDVRVAVPVVKTIPAKTKAEKPVKETVKKKSAKGGSSSGRK